MSRALELALLGPAQGVNPQVGAVILDEKHQIVAEGYHKGSGTDHAEVMAIKELRAKTGDSSFPGHTAVVTLEPCNHTGKTGPCSKALADAGISRVVYAVSDPGKDSGGGAEFLRGCGVEVIAGVGALAAEEQSRVWLTANRLERPFVTLKWASSLDGRTAATDGSSKWISGEMSRSDSHKRRSEVDAILVGTGTALADDPELTARDDQGGYYEHQPLRVVLGERELPGSLRVFNDRAESLHLKTRDVAHALKELYSRGVKHVWVEGGPAVASKFVELDLVDEFIIYLAPMLLGGDKVALQDIGVGSVQDAAELEIVEQKLLDQDLFIRARRK
ncbi:MAG: bifunctional diaminohydroxyphosphoribosylaminopyrimidine deaminase/5-amino-6-(5-phosphoribosylamino)uracil reductase RibD [Candidatus Aquiluna sp. XM-24bin5]|nr:MAG: bifunctional diaminohydroxyphosphoribosylaminopyrimidine deaminase/5-amino-6-(5-phosphoribosylamino)uracil reductase RibD [Candidatus Aquiluna sp. XM-24bin5]